MTVPGVGRFYGGEIVLISRALLDEYLVASKSVLVRMFDFTRFRQRSFNGWGSGQEETIVRGDDLAFRLRVEPGHASYSRGFQIIRSKDTVGAVLRRLQGLDRTEPKQYATFIAHDWKHKELREISCSPDALGNYFVKSELPFGTSPAFFRPDVLLRYKTDPDKYHLTERSISCRNAWHLETYDINDAGQVHTYLVYLGRLPYDEQLYWKAFNEEPKAPISKRAFTTDFEGNFHGEHEPLPSLKNALDEVRRANVGWWTLRAENLIDHVHYPVTTAPDEWANELLNLDQLLVEGLEERWLRQRATSLRREPDPRLRSLKLQKLRADALKKHGSLRKHFMALCKSCDETVRIIEEAFSRVDDAK